MDKLKDKLSKLSLLGGSKQAKGAFQGTGHRLGSAPAQAAGTARPSQPQQPAAASRPLPRLAVPPPPATAGTSQAAAQPATQQQQQQQQQQQVQQQPPEPLAAAAALPGAGAAAGSRPSSAAAAVAAAAQAPQASASSSAAPPAPAAAAALEPPPEEHPAYDQVGLAVSQLASDPAGPAAAEVLAKLLSNVATAPGEPKYRRVRLSNPRIQSAVVDVSGGVELLLACGFEVVFEEGGGAASAGGAQQAGEEPSATEGFAVLSPEADLAPLQHALGLLGPLLPSGTPSAPPSSSSSAAAPSTAPSAASSIGSAAQQAGAAAPRQQQPQQLQQRQQRPREWDPPRERNTQVVLPVSVEREVPDWFFQRTGQELKAAFLAATRRREQDQVLMTRATRERLMRGARPPEASFATIKIKFPEGISLQGEFSPGEPVAAVFAWVADCLSDPLHTYELVLPSRQALEPRAQSVREAQLMPSVVLLFRWTGESAAAMAHVPALRADLLRAARPAAAAY